MTHTFSSLSPKHQTSAQIESKNPLAIANSRNDNDSLINPFSIAARRDSDANSEGEVTAEGFFKCKESDRREEVNFTMLSAASPSKHPPSLLLNSKPLPNQH